MAINVKLHIGRLSALCGCGIAAGIGAACGLVLLHGGNADQMAYACQTMAADVSGMICDGAKPGCALKVATAASAANRAALLAMNNGQKEGHFGIVAHSVEQTLDNLGTLGENGMGAANREILQMLLSQQHESGTAS